MVRVSKLFLKYFIVGILALIPAVIVIQVLLFLERILRELFIYIYGYSSNVLITLLAFMVSFSTFTYLGYRITKSEKLFNRIPLIRTIYRVSKKLVTMLGDQENSLAKEIVFIEYPKEGLWVPGYVTNRAGEILG